MQEDLTVPSPPARFLKGRAVGLGILFVVALAIRLWYGSAWPEPGRFWDERYALDNPRSIMTEGTLKPSKVYYPSPVFNLPAAAVLAVAEKLVDDPRTWILDRETGVFGPGAYRLLRGLQGVFGALAVVVIYFVGLRVFGPTEAALAACMMAFIPWQIRVGGVFKPDALLGLTVVLVLLWSIRLLERPGFLSALLAGLGIALAMSAKMTGGVLAIPLALAMFWLYRKEFRSLVWLVAAGAVSAGFFVLLNPYWWAYPVWLRVLSRDYAMRAEWQGMRRWEIPGRALEFLTSRYTLGLLVGLIAVAGYLVLVHRLVRRTSGDRIHRAQLLLLVTFPPLFVAIYAIQTAYFKPNNFLPIVPFLILGGASLIAGVARRVDQRWGPFRYSASGAAIAIVSAWMATRGYLFVYRSLIPSTSDAAQKFLTRSPRDRSGQYAMAEAVPVRLPPWAGSRRLASSAVKTIEVPRLANISEDSLDLADGEIFLGDGLDSAFHDRRLNRVRVSSWRTFQSRPFVLRGPTVTAIVHNYRRVASHPLQPMELGDRRFQFGIPQIKRGSIASLYFRIPTERHRFDGTLPQIYSGKRVLTVYPVRKRTGARYYATQRFYRSEIQSVLQLVTPSESDLEGIVVRLIEWKRLRLRLRLPRSEADVVGIGKPLEKRQVEPGEKG